VNTLLQIGLANALVATLLALLVAGAGKFCRRPALVHTLWLLVLLKLITPAPFSLPVSWPATLVLEDAGARVATGEGTVDGGPLPSSILSLRSALSAVPWGPLVLSVWLTGSVLWFLLAAVRCWRFARLLCLGQPAPRAIQDQAELLAEDLDLARCPQVWLMPGILSPMLWGLGNATRLLLPAELLGRLDGDQLRTLLAHELAHQRRRDPWVRPFELLALGLYWWHPVAWWACRRLREAEEQCCDAWVVWTLPAAAPSYATALVETVAFLARARPALPPVASGVSYVPELKRRLTLILCGTPPKGLSVGSLLTVLVLALLLLPWRPVLGQDEPAELSSPVSLPVASLAGTEGEMRSEQSAVAGPVAPLPMTADPSNPNDMKVAPAPQPPERGRVGWDRSGMPWSSAEWRTWAQQTWGRPEGRGGFRGGWGWRGRAGLSKLDPVPRQADEPGREPGR
jgi:beta-lactamase regulating signal transducer with metallopeptidase domain